MLNSPIDKLLRVLDRTLSKTMFVFIIAGVVLSCLHQSSLGTLMIISGSKMHPLWQTPILPLLFLMSAISVGFPMVIFESLISSRSFGLKPETPILSRLALFMPPLLGVYLSVKIIDIAIRGTYIYLFMLSAESVMFLTEILIGIALPLRLFLLKSVRNSPVGLFITSSLVIFGVFLNRLNNFVVAYTPPYELSSYFPSIGEISVTIGFISLEILLYRVCVMNFPVISTEIKQNTPAAKYSIRGKR